MIIDSKGLVKAANVTNPPKLYKDSSICKLEYLNVISSENNVEQNPTVKYERLEEILEGAVVSGVSNFNAPNLESIKTRKGSDYFKDVRKNLSMKKLKDVYGKLFFKDCQNIELGEKINFHKSLNLENSIIGNPKKYMNQQIDVTGNLYLNKDSEINTNTLIVKKNLYIDDSGFLEVPDLNVLGDIYIKKTENCPLKYMNISLENLSKSFNKKIYIQEKGNSDLKIKVPDIHADKVEYIKGDKTIHLIKGFLKNYIFQKIYSR